ncbi:unnamed protein product [Agarophyton chilense]
MANSRISFAGLLAFFERESCEHASSNDVSKQSAKADSQNTESNVVQKDGINEKQELGSIVEDLMEEIFAHLRDRNMSITEQLYSAARGDTADGARVNVSREVLKREIVLALANSFQSRSEKNAGVTNSERDQATINSLKRCLHDMTCRATDAEETLELELNDKIIVMFTCEQYKERSKELASALRKRNNEVYGLTAKNASLAKMVQSMEEEIERLRKAVHAGDVKALQAQHDAEMAHLLAKQATLQSKLLEKQLQEAERSSNTIHAQAEELQREQRGIRTLLVNNLDRQEARNVRGQFGVQVEALVRKGSTALGRVGATLTRNATERRGVGANELGTPSERRNNDNSNNCSVPSNAGQLPVDSPSSSRNAGEATPRPGISRKLTARFRRNGGNVGEHAASETQGKRGPVLDGLRNLKRPNHRTENNPGSVPTANEGASMLRHFRRIFSMGSGSGRSGQRSQRSGYTDHDNGVSKTSKKLDALDKNLETLQDIAGSKQKEVSRLREELRAAKHQSDALEQRLRTEQYKRVAAERSRSFAQLDPVADAENAEAVRSDRADE